jgi:glycosyltransferase involved in cell wall biosynthesis
VSAATPEAPLRVAFFIDSLSSGGAQRQIVEIACALHRARRADARLLAYQDLNFFKPVLEAAGVPFTLIRKRARLDPLLPSRLRGWLSQERPHVLHAFLSVPGLYGWLAIRGMKGSMRPSFVAAERFELDGIPRWEGAIKRFVYRRSDAVTANAGPVAREIVTRYGVAEERVVYIPNGIDLDDWDARASRRDPLALEASRFHLALVGGLRAQKNHLGLLDALAGIDPSLRRDWTVWFIGDETGEAGMADAIRRRIVESDLSACVRIVPATREIAAVMGRLDLLVLPSHGEGFPNVVLEAMASRLPVVASRVGDVASLIDAGVTGLLVDPGDESGLRAAILHLAQLPREGRRAMGERARRVVEERYRIAAVAAQYAALYARLAARHAR